jgi:hypothetical protein
LIYTWGCSDDPYEASRDFAETRERVGTKKNTVLSQHFIQSFMPGEITPEKALEIGKELCDKLLHGEYQYYLAVHTDKDHIHLHCIFNNVNKFDGRTFETHENRKSDPSCKKLLNFSDEICRENYLSVIEDHESTKGKSHYEWDMSRQGLSWKTKLKYAIDQAVKNSEDFDDFIWKCKDFGIIVDYNPKHKIDLKFMLEEQKKNNPRAKMTRAKTLGWFYESKQIRHRIENYKGIMSYTPHTKIIQTTLEKVRKSSGYKHYADRNNMIETSRAINLLSKQGVTREEINQAAHAAFVRKGMLAERLNRNETMIEETREQIKTAKIYQKYRKFHDELKTLSGRQKTKYLNEHRSELDKYNKAVAKHKEWYPSGKATPIEELEKKLNALYEERSKMDGLYKVAKAECEELSKAIQTVDDYLENERNVQEQKRKKDDLE